MNHVLVLIIFNYFSFTKCDLYRLPTGVEPDFYTLRIKTDLEVYSGNVTIDIRVASSINSIKLHSSNLTITKALLDGEEASYYLYPEYEILEILYENKAEILPGCHKIYLEYDGKLQTEKQAGFLRATFTQNKTVSSVLAITDNQPTFARSTFPCFDEPALKARFRLTVIVPYRDNYFALSNTQADGRFKNSEGYVNKFEITPRMSTYLLTIAVTNYTYIRDVLKINNRSIPIRLFSYNLTHSEQAKKILAHTKDTLLFLNDYLGSEGYPLKKLDLIEYDRNRSSATENWGLITFRKGIINFSSEENFVFEGCTKIVAHELAHFYFGNLVTNAWWDDLWLQEAFSEFMGLKVMTNITNSSSWLHTSKVVEIENAIEFEVRNRSTPIINTVKTPSEILDHFNKLTYYKGSTILAMLESSVGEDNMRKILRDYVREFQFKSATTSDFLKIVDNVDQGGFSREFLESFLYQRCFPLITVRDENKVYFLEQKTWNQNCTHKWTIPMTFKTDIDKDYVPFFFNKDFDYVNLAGDSWTWVKFNTKYDGYYQIVYEKKILDNLLQHINELGFEDRYSLAAELLRSFRWNFAPCDSFFEFFTDLVKNFREHVKNLYVHLKMFLLKNGLQKDKEAYIVFKDYSRRLRQFVTNETIDEVMQKQDANNAPLEKLFADAPITDQVQKCADFMKANLTNYIL